MYLWDRGCSHLMSCTDVTCTCLVVDLYRRCRFLGWGGCGKMESRCFLVARMVALRGVMKMKQTIASV